MWRLATAFLPLVLTALPSCAAVMERSEAASLSKQNGYPPSTQPRRVRLRATVTVRGPLGPDDVGPLLVAAQPHLEQRCLQLVAPQGRLTGRVVFYMVIGASGQVQSVTLMENTTGQSAVVECLRTSLLAMTGFPPRHAPTNARVEMHITSS